MTMQEICRVVRAATKVTRAEMFTARKGTGLYAKYIAIMLMHEDGHKDMPISEVLKTSRSNVAGARRRIDSLLTDDTLFKTMYLSCIKALTELEDAA